MPCYNTTTTTIAISATDPQLLAQALRDSGAYPDAVMAQLDALAELFIARGKITVPDRYADRAARVMQLYAEKAVAKVGARYGWRMRQTGQRRMQLQRR